MSARTGNRWWRRVLAAAVVVGMAGLAFPQSAAAQQPSTPGVERPAVKGKDKPKAAKPGSEEPAQAGPPKVGARAPEWTAVDPDGKEHRLSDYKGKIVVMDFWATWCPPCRKAMPGMQRIHERYKDRGVVVLGMNAWQSRGGPDPVKYMKDNKFTYGLMLKADAAATAYQLTGIPAFFVVAQDGTLAYANTEGYSEEGEKRLEQAIEALLKEPREPKKRDPGGSAPAPAGGDGGATPAPPASDPRPAPSPAPAPAPRP